MARSGEWVLTTPSASELALLRTPRFVYEGHPQFSVMPMLACTFPFCGAASPVDELGRRAGVVFDPAALVHGEHELVLHAPLTHGGMLANTTRCTDVVDRGTGALVRLETRTTDATTGRAIATNTMGVFIRGLGGFTQKLAAAKGRSAGGQATALPPPDALLECNVPPGAAALYRLTGDLNPLHIDPAFAQRGGFAAPILHGLCTLGTAVRCILAHASDAEHAPVTATAVKCRFTGPVIPGQTLHIRIWYPPHGAPHTSARFSVTADGRPAIDGGEVHLRRGEGGHTAAARL
jgi:acyl dehydratase